MTLQYFVLPNTSQQISDFKVRNQKINIAEQRSQLDNPFKFSTAQQELIMQSPQIMPAICRCYIKHHSGQLDNSYHLFAADGFLFELFFKTSQLNSQEFSDDNANMILAAKKQISLKNLFANSKVKEDVHLNRNNSLLENLPETLQNNIAEFLAPQDILTKPAKEQSWLSRLLDNMCCRSDNAIKR